MSEAISWKKLRRGDVVTVKPVHGRAMEATIDDYFQDRRMVWIRLHDTQERRIITPRDGIEIVRK
ncbi:hypothetical protein ACIPWF_18375 [Paenarthrobacter sp. NPDC089989]|uniref:hypothetical protein n=1 Tax=unclassified Paenarthrobacter TaxID=2634190 RepID=UPI003824B535